MPSLNKVTILGNVGRDPEIRTFPNGGRIANVTIATTEKWKDKSTGEKREATEWHRVNFHDRLAEVVEQYIFKGSSVYVEGSLHTRKWTDKAGVEKYSTEIKAHSMLMLGNPSPAPETREREQTRPAAAPAQRRAAPSRPSPSGFEDMDDDIPF